MIRTERREVTMDDRNPYDLLRETDARVDALLAELADARRIAREATAELARLIAEHERDSRRVYAWPGAQA